MRSIIRFFDKAEDRVRQRLSRYPIIYALFGGTGIVLFWRGVWHTFDFVIGLLFSVTFDQPVDLGDLPWWDGPVSFTLGIGILLMTGIFVSNFIGNEIIISGLRGEKKLAEKTVVEVHEEASILISMQEEIRTISQKVSNLEDQLPRTYHRSMEEHHV